MHVKPGQSQNERERWKKTLGRISLHDSSGRPRLGEAESAAVKIAEEVEREMTRLKPGFHLRSERQKPGRYVAEDEVQAELEGMRYSPFDVQTILESASLGGAANRVVAARHERTPRSIGAAAADGRRQLGRTPR